MAETGYVPGVCNIGQEEIGRRLRAGWIGLAVTLVLLAALVWAGVNPWWRPFIFFPAALSASGFLQAQFKFCSGFARRGIFNFGPLGETREVGSEEAKARDRRRGMQITFYAVLIGLLAALVAVFS